MFYKFEKKLSVKIQNLYNLKEMEVGVGKFWKHQKLSIFKNFFIIYPLLK